MTQESDANASTGDSNTVGPGSPPNADQVGGEWFGDQGFDAFLVRDLIGLSNIGNLSAKQLWIVKCAVIQELVTSKRVRKILAKAAESAMRELR